MAHHTRVRANLAAWQATPPVDPTEMEKFDADNLGNIDGDTGGVWAPSSVIEIGGSGLKVSGILEIVNGLVKNAQQLEVQSGGTLKIDSGAIFTILQALVLNGAAGDVNPAISTTVAPTTRKVLWQMTFGTPKLRIYQRAATTNFVRGFEITINASWNGTQWVADDTAASARIFAISQGPALSVTAGDENQLYIAAKASTGSAWNENAWDSGGLSLAPQVPTATAASLPKNLVSPASVIKAWGVIVTDGVGGASISEGYGLDATLTFGSGDLTVTLRNAMASFNFHIGGNLISPLGAFHVQYVPLSTTTFKVRVTNTSTSAAINLSATATAFSFDVVGKQ
jgi:hypothetical protein